MGRWFDIRVGHQNRAIRPDQIGDAFGEWNQCPPSPDGLRQLVAAVAEQTERKIVLFGELSVLFRAIVGNTEDFDAEFLEFVPAVPQLVGFECSTGCAGLGIEKEQERTTFEIGTRNRSAIMGLQFEIDKRFSDWNHLTSCSVSDRNEHQYQNRHQ